MASLIQNGSVPAFRSIPLQSAYRAAKHATQGFAESVRTELMHERSCAHLTTVQFPAVNTPHFGWMGYNAWIPSPVSPVYQQEVVARAVYHQTPRESDGRVGRLQVELAQKFRERNP